MSMGPGARLALADRCVERIIEVLGPVAEEVAAAGSVRRRRPQVGDIELVVRPRMHPDLFGDETPELEPLHAALNELGNRIKGGDRYVRIDLGKMGDLPFFALDVFIVHPPAQWGSILAIRTGPWDLSREIVTMMRHRGYRHENGHARRIDTGELVPPPTEEAFFALAGVEYVEPHERDSLAERLLGPGANR